MNAILTKSSTHYLESFGIVFGIQSDYVERVIELENIVNPIDSPDYLMGLTSIAEKIYSVISPAHMIDRVSSSTAGEFLKGKSVGLVFNAPSLFPIILLGHKFGLLEERPFENEESVQIPHEFYRGQERLVSDAILYFS